MLGGGRVLICHRPGKQLPQKKVLWWSGAGRNLGVCSYLLSLEMALIHTWEAGSSHAHHETLVWLFLGGGGGTDTKNKPGSI